MTTKTVTKKSPRSATAVDPIKLLMDDHKEVHALFQKYMKLAAKGADGAERQPLAEQICLLLIVHTTIEEEIFYPAAREAMVEPDLLDEAEVEHASCKELIAQIRGMDADDDLYDAKVTVLGEYIAHHVNEEEGELFPECRKTSMDMSAIGAQMSERKDALISEVTETAEAQ